MKYDVIGDVHGQAVKLEKLLLKLGYREKSGVFTQSGHQAVFLGDFIDRGPEQLKTVRIIRAMVEAGSAMAVMGNHEYNAIAWHIPDPLFPGTFLRSRNGVDGENNRAHHFAFLSEVELFPKTHLDVISWFLSLPLWLEFPGFRVVHACWHRSYIAELEKCLQIPGRLSVEDFVKSCRPELLLHRFVNGVIKGVELDLPDGLSYMDKTGKQRRNYRVAWWNQSATTLRNLALVDEENKLVIPDVAISEKNLSAYDNVKPVFFGHYWMIGAPSIQSPKIACLDYSGEPKRPIVAYRWDGEGVLINDNFVVVVD